MTIQLTQARVVNGAVAAVGTQHTLATATEADFVTNGWATYVGQPPNNAGPQPVYSQANLDGSTSLVGAGGDPLLTVEEPSKNIIANVNHRTGTLSSLLTLDGGVGEISVATDYDAIVRHNGVSGQAIAFFNPFVEIYQSPSLTTSATAGALTGLNCKDLESVNGIGTTTDPSGNIIKPSWANFITVTGQFAFAGNATGTVRRCQLQVSVNNGANWGNKGQISLNPNGSSATFNVPVAFQSDLNSSITHVRLAATSDAGVGLSVTTSLLAVKFERF